SWAAVIYWLAPMMLLKWTHQFQNVIEHFGLTHADDTWVNTRSTRSGALMRWVCWNMQYHTAHHTYPAVPFHPLPELNRELVARTGYHGMPIDLAFTDVGAARKNMPLFEKHKLGCLINAFPKTIEALRPVLRMAKDFNACFVNIIGQVMPLTVEGMIPVIRQWLAMAEEEGVEIQFETHRNCITNDLFTTLQLLDAIPELRLCADLSHYLV